MIRLPPNPLAAVLLSLKGAAGFQLDMKYNKQGQPSYFGLAGRDHFGIFFDRLSWFEDILALVSFFVALVGALIIFATLRTVMNEKSGNMRLSVVWVRAVWWLPAWC